MLSITGVNHAYSASAVQCSAAEWEWAYSAALRELGPPRPVKRRGDHRLERQTHSLRITNRAWELVYMRRVLGPDFRKGGS